MSGNSVEGARPSSPSHSGRQHRASSWGPETNRPQKDGETPRSATFDAWRGPRPKPLNLIRDDDSSSSEDESPIAPKKVGDDKLAMRDIVSARDGSSQRFDFVRHDAESVQNVVPDSNVVSSSENERTSIQAKKGEASEAVSTVLPDSGNSSWLWGKFEALQRSLSLTKAEPIDENWTDVTAENVGGQGGKRPEAVAGHADAVHGGDEGPEAVAGHADAVHGGDEGPEADAVHADAVHGGDEGPEAVRGQADAVHGSPEVRTEQEEAAGFVEVSDSVPINVNPLERKIQIYRENNAERIAGDKKPPYLIRVIFGDSRESSILDEIRIRKIIENEKNDQIDMNLEIYEMAHDKIDKQYKDQLDPLINKIEKKKQKVERLEDEIETDKEKIIQLQVKLAQDKMKIVELENEVETDKQDIEKSESRATEDKQDIEDDKIEYIRVRMEDNKNNLKRMERLVKGQEKYIEYHGEIIEKKEEILENLKKSLEDLVKASKEIEDKKASKVEKLFSTLAGTSMETFKTGLQRIAAEHDFQIKDRGTKLKPKLGLGLRLGKQPSTW